MNTPTETGKRMNLYELLLKEGALSNASVRSAVAAKILTGEISALVTIHPGTPSGMSTSSLIRNALSGQSKSYQASPLNVPKYRKVLDDMAMGEHPDADALRQIEVDGAATAAQNKASNSQLTKKRASAKSVIVPYLAKLLEKTPLLMSSELLALCIKNAVDAESPFGTYQNSLTRKGSKNIISNEVFAAWFTEARKLNQKP